MDELDERFSELRGRVEPHVRQPDFSVIRGRHRRRVRNQRIASGTLAVVAVTAGYGVATRALDDAAPRLDQAAAVGEYVPPATGEFGARDVAFVDATKGWAIGARCAGEGPAEACEMGVSSTTDAGDTWSAPVPLGPVVTRDVLRTSRSATSGAARSIRFFNTQVGYAFNPALYVTTDAGRSWRAVPVADEVVGVTPYVAGVLVTTRHCAPGGVACMTRVLRDAQADGTLAELPAPSLAPPGADLPIVRVDGNEIWVLSYGPDEQFLEVSTDSGRRWRGTNPPCEQYDRQHFSAAGGAVWVACTVVDPQDDRRSAKTVFVSTDDGASWQRRGAPDALGVTNDLRAIDDEVAYLSSSHGDLLRTTDGGRTWQVALDGEGYINLEFVGPGRGWFFGPKGALWRYVDGDAERLAGPR